MAEPGFEPRAVRLQSPGRRTSGCAPSQGGIPVNGPICASPALTARFTDEETEIQNCQGFWFLDQCVAHSRCFINGWESGREPLYGLQNQCSPDGTKELSWGQIP